MQKEYLEIVGGNKLCGSVKLHSAKNAVLPLLAASIMTDEKVIIKDCPFISDIDNMIEILKLLSVDVVRQGRDISVNGKPQLTTIPENLAKAMRSSVFLLGALLSECGKVKLYSPGGCNIGARPIDIHLDGLKKLGANIKFGDDYVECEAPMLVGAEIVLKYPSVGATENLILASVKAKGDSVIIGCAKEPEIVCLCQMLNSMGAKISGAGTPIVKISGVDCLDGTNIVPIYDRIVAGTILSAVAVCGGSIKIENCTTEYLGAFLKEMLSSHFSVIEKSGLLIVESDGIVLPSNIITGPYPLFPTDLQPIMTAVQCFANGQSKMTETVFENRFAHIGELAKMGADIDIDNYEFLVNGRQMKGANINAYDLRGGAGLVVASLGAKGVSQISGVKYIDRGYEKIEEMFDGLGANICRKKDFSAN